MLGFVKGYEIDFIDLPVQNSIPREYVQNVKQKSVLQIQIDDLVERNVVTKIDHDTDVFISNVFGRLKPNGDTRMIIDLTNVNEHVQKCHFKMDHLEVALDLMEEGVFMSSIDLKDAYYSVPIWGGHRKYLTFQWEREIFSFNVLPFGLCSAPRVFTKLLKPVFSKMREDGFCVLGYLDDSLIMGNSESECALATSKLEELLINLGFSLNREKSSLVPSTTITFLGYVLNSLDMTVSPTDKKRQKASEIIEKLLSQRKHKIRFVASALGFIVDLGKGVEYGANHFRYLERDKILALRCVGSIGYEGSMYLSREAKQELKWWRHNVKTRVKKIRSFHPSVILTTDASSEGWGAICNGESIGGRWTPSELEKHINVLELEAVLLGLQSFFKNKREIEISVKSDNTTAISYINRMGGSKSKECLSVAKSIWNFCEDREIWVIASYIPGVDNNEADYMSRNFTDNTEWTLNPHIFDKICEKWGTPEIDMFASRVNHIIYYLC